jgi:hypothetical protein
MQFLWEHSMNTTTAQTARDCCLIASFALIAGFTSMVICEHELEHAPQLTKAYWPQAELHTAASAAIEFQKDNGRLPYSLDELRAARAGTYLPREFDLKGVMYFRDGGDRPRLSWRDDVHRGVAYCSLDAALHEHC